MKNQAVRYGDWYLLSTANSKDLDQLRFLTLLRISGGQHSRLRSYLSMVEFAPICQELQHWLAGLQLSPMWLFERDLIELYRPSPARDYLIFEHTRGNDLHRSLQAYGITGYYPTGRQLEQIPMQAVQLKGRPRAWQLTAVYPRA